jgi:hypothetical protein
LDSVATDGHYVYVSDNYYKGCSNVRRISIATGATSVLSSAQIDGLAFGPDGFLYGVRGSALYRIHPSNGTRTQVAEWTYAADSLTVDDQFAWVTDAAN